MDGQYPPRTLVYGYAVDCIPLKTQSAITAMELVYRMSDLQKHSEVQDIVLRKSQASYLVGSTSSPDTLPYLYISETVIYDYGQTTPLNSHSSATAEMRFTTVQMSEVSTSSHSQGRLTKDEAFHFIRLRCVREWYTDNDSTNVIHALRIYVAAHVCYNRFVMFVTLTSSITVMTFYTYSILSIL